MAHLHFIQTHKAKQKNTKELVLQHTKTIIKIYPTETTIKTLSSYAGFTKLAVKCSADTFELDQTWLPIFKVPALLSI
jgi:hypothetical protein